MVFLLTWLWHQDYLSLVMTYWQPQYFRFFQSPSFLFSHKFCTTEFWAGFWWRWFCGIYGSSSLSLPFNLHLFPVCLSHKVQSGLEDIFSKEEHLIHRLSLTSISVFSAAIFFSIWVEAFATPTRCFWVTWGWVRVVDLFSWRVINSSSMYMTLLINSPKFWWSSSTYSQRLAGSIGTFLRSGRLTAF